MYALEAGVEYGSIDVWCGAGAEWTLGMEFETEGMVVGMNLTWDTKREASRA